MGTTTKKEYLQAIRPRYQKGSKAQKTIILEEFCAVCGYNRKYAIRLLNATQKRKTRAKPCKRGRKKQYNHPYILDVLWDLWIANNCPCSKRLKAIIPLWLPFFDKYLLPEEVKQKLLMTSAATIDRLMAKNRNKFNKRGRSTTKPGSILKQRIPIKTNQWDETIPGFLEADTVAHCGTSIAGSFVYTVNCVDIASGWTIQRAVWEKGEQGVIKAITDIENDLPFPLLGFDCDNGSEFLNWHLHRYFTKRKRPIQFTRCRAYHKNDNAHIEGKNWTHIRQYLGYQRFDNTELVPMLNQLYTTEWSLYFNFFCPSVKLIEKRRDGSKIIKKHDSPKTPYQRIVDNQQVAPEIKNQLTQIYNSLNPFTLQKQMKRKIIAILNAVNQQHKLSTYPQKEERKKEAKKERRKTTTTR